LYQAEKDLFPGKYTANSVWGQYECSLRTYNWIVAFEKVTGGGGDADNQDYKDRIERARNQGFEIGSLSDKQVASWYDNRWYNLFHDWYIFCSVNPAPY